MKIIFLSLLGCIAFVPAYLNAQVQLEQQERPYKSNAVYLELGGPGLIYSLGYEATFYHNRQLSIIPVLEWNTYRYRVVVAPYISNPAHFIISEKIALLNSGWH
jgi:hypothetical protein